MRNLPAFTSVRKALAAGFLCAGAAGWLAAFLRGVPARGGGAEIWVERLPASELWPAGCLPTVASSRGRRYYFAWCEGASRLKAQNLRRFCGPEDAEKAGFLPAESCVEA